MMDPFPTGRCGNTARSACSRFPASRTVGVTAPMDDQTSVQAPSTRLKVGRTGADRRWPKCPLPEGVPRIRSPVERRGLLQHLASALDTRSTSCTRVDLLAFMVTLRAYRCGQP